MVDSNKIIGGRRIAPYEQHIVRFPEEPVSATGKAKTWKPPLICNICGSDKATDVCIRRGYF